MRSAAFASAVAMLSTGCSMDVISTRFSDPAKYDLYECKQLVNERNELEKRESELRGLIQKAHDGAAGPVIAEVAYGPDYVTAREQMAVVNELRHRKNCPD
jgi:hypothetical protein